MPHVSCLTALHWPWWLRCHGINPHPYLYHNSACDNSYLTHVAYLFPEVVPIVLGITIFLFNPTTYGVHLHLCAPRRPPLPPTGGDVRGFSAQQLGSVVWSLAVLKQVDSAPFRWAKAHCPCSVLGAAGAAACAA